MRVIAGTAKGTHLASVPPGVRPVSDRAREGLFSSLGGAVAGAFVLDLYAGTGAVGIEALSRGAAGVVFVERAPAAVATIRENLRRTRLGERARVVRSDAVRFLRRWSEQPFDLAIADPPYDLAPGALEEVLALLDRHLGPGAIVALTRPKRSSTHVVPLHWRTRGRLGYGDSLVFLYRRTEEG